MLSFTLVNTQSFAQDSGDDNANVESEQLEATILELRSQLMKLEGERASASAPASVVSGFTGQQSSVSSLRSGSGVFDSSQVLSAVQTQLPTQSYAVAPYYQTLPLSNAWVGQSMPIQSAPMMVASPVQPVYEAPAIEYIQPAPVVQQPVVVQQAPAPQVAPTIIVNIHQPAPVIRNSYTPPILAPIHGPAPVQIVSPRRGCCLFGRR